MLQDPTAKIIELYLKDIANQTRGSHRVRNAHRQGTLLAQLLNLLKNTFAEQAIAGYVERAQLRLKIANQDTGKLHDYEQALLFFALTERIAFDTLLKLDQYDALGSIHRISKCARCSSWFWKRVPGPTLLFRKMSRSALPILA